MTQQEELNLIRMLDGSGVYAWVTPVRSLNPAQWAAHVAYGDVHKNLGLFNSREDAVTRAVEIALYDGCRESLLKRE